MASKSSRWFLGIIGSLIVASLAVGGVIFKSGVLSSKVAQNSLDLETTKREVAELKVSYSEMKEDVGKIKTNVEWLVEGFKKGKF